MAACGGKQSQHFKNSFPAFSKTSKNHKESVLVVISVIYEKSMNYKESGLVAISVIYEKSRNHKESGLVVISVLTENQY